MSEIFSHDMRTTNDAEAAYLQFQITCSSFPLILPTEIWWTYGRTDSEILPKGIIYFQRIVDTCHFTVYIVLFITKLLKNAAVSIN